MASWSNGLHAVGHRGMHENDVVKRRSTIKLQLKIHNVFTVSHSGELYVCQSVAQFPIGHMIRLSKCCALLSIESIYQGKQK